MSFCEYIVERVKGHRILRPADAFLHGFYRYQMFGLIFYAPVIKSLIKDDHANQAKTTSDDCPFEENAGPWSFLHLGEQEGTNWSMAASNHQHTFNALGECIFKMNLCSKVDLS